MQFPRFALIASVTVLTVLWSTASALAVKLPPLNTGSTPQARLANAEFLQRLPAGPGGNTPVCVTETGVVATQELYGKIMFLLQAPARRIAVALAAVSRNLAVTVNEAAKANKFAQ